MKLNGIWVKYQEISKLEIQIRVTSYLIGSIMKSQRNLVTQTKKNAKLNYVLPNFCILLSMINCKKLKNFKIQTALSKKIYTI